MLTDQHKEIITATVPLLRENGITLTKHFYNRMFTHHPELKNLFNLGNQNSGKQQTALAMAVLAYAENIANPSVLMPVVDLIGHKHTSLNIQPEQYEIVGSHLLTSIKEVLGDLASDEVIGAWAIAYQQLANLMIGHEKTMYDKKQMETGNWIGWRTFVVKSKIEESGEIVSFYLTPKDGEKIAQHLPGQYLSVKVFLPELQLDQIRQYSISCAPNNAFYRISVKREKGAHVAINGRISNFLHDHILEGSELELSAPSGNFILNDSDSKKVFISGGIGQTPLLSMLEDIDLKKIKETEIIWIHGCRNKNVHAFRDKVKHIQKNNDNINIFHFYDVIEEQLTDHTIMKGPIDFRKIKNWYFDTDAEYYLCGPKAFIENMLKELNAHNIDRKHIYYEEFGPKSI